MTFLVLFPAAAALCIEFGKTVWHRGSLPGGYGGSQSIYMPRQIFRPCEIAVWKVPVPPPLGKSGSGKKWQTTPYSNEHAAGDTGDRWLNGIGCSSVAAEVRDSLVDAMTTPGAVYQGDKNDGFIFVPSKGLLVHSYNY